MTKKRLVSRAELARIAGVSAMAITKACASKLRPACHDKRVDLDHPLVTEYLFGKGRTAPTPPSASVSAAAQTGAARGAKKKRARRPPTRPESPERTAERGADPPAVRLISELPEGPSSIEDIEQYAHMSLSEIARRFGSMGAHRDWLEMRKRQVEIQEKEIKNAELRGKLIPRDLVRQHVFAAIEECNNRLLADSAKTIARRLYNLAKSGTPIEEAEATVRELIGAVLHPVKMRAARALRRRAERSSEAEAQEHKK